MSQIDPRAVIDPRAELGENVTVGPYTVIGPDVLIGDGTWVGPHVVINGPIRIGRDNQIFQFASIGEISQDKTAKRSDPTRVEIGDRNTIREYVTIQRGTLKDQGVTRVGNDNWIMAYCHIAHDCVVGNGTTFANNASLAGHVVIDDHVILGGYTLVYQFTRLGAYSFSAFGSHINMDVPPFVMVQGQLAKPRAMNTEGMRRHGKPPETIQAMKRAYRVLYREGLRVEEAREQLVEMAKTTPEIQLIVDFLAQSQRGIIR